MFEILNIGEETYLVAGRNSPEIGYLSYSVLLLWGSLAERTVIFAAL